jgi:ferredoxin--NADP+ reductase
LTPTGFGKFRRNLHGAGSAAADFRQGGREDKGGSRLLKATIVRREDFTDDLFVLWLDPEAEFTFRAGQYITIGAGGFERPYSIVSAPYEPFIELFIEYVPPEHGGKLTPILHASKVGDIVTMRPKAKGLFTLRAEAKSHVMMGTVTGVAPYVSMIRQFLHDRATGMDGLSGYRFFVIEGASHQDEFVYDKELRRLSNEYPDLIQFVCSVSRPQAQRNADWTGPIGRVNLLIEDYLERWKLPLDNTVIYLCGNPGMIEDVKARLIPKGWSIAEERFWR